MDRLFLPAILSDVYFNGAGRAEERCFIQDSFWVSAKFDEKHVEGGEVEWKVLFWRNYKRIGTYLGRICKQASSTQKFRPWCANQLRFVNVKDIRCTNGKYLIRVKHPHFSFCESVFSSAHVSNTHLATSPRSPNRLTEIQLTTSQVYEILSKIDPNKSSGPDNLPGRIFKEVAAEISPKNG